jgi:DNA/RNA endonuclease YhcR with UshA esterase domain
MANFSMGVRGHVIVCIGLALLAAAAVAYTHEPARRVYSPNVAGAYAGQTITVEGRASVYAAHNGVIFIDMGGSGRSSPFAAVIFKDDMAAFPNIFRYDGKVIDVSGQVQKFKGKPQIILKSADQLQSK